MKILFVYTLTDVMSVKKPLLGNAIQPGISYISALLKFHGHETDLLVLSPDYNSLSTRMLEKYLLEYEPQVLAYTSIATQYKFIKSLAEKVRMKHPGIFQIIGGPHPTLMPDEVIVGPFDALCIGEGEYPSLELVTQISQYKKPQGIANLWIKNGKSIEKNPPRPFIQDLDSLPFPDRDMWCDWINLKFRPRFQIDIGRGCPFDCSYCCNHVFRKVAKGAYVRYRSPSDIVAEAESLTHKFPEMNELYLQMETFGINLGWAIQLCDALREFNECRPHPIKFGTSLRVTPNCDFNDLFASMHKANFTFVAIGLESGCDRVRREIMRREYSNDDILRTVKAARTHSLQVHLFNIIGLPTETLEEAMMTVDVNRRALPDWHYTSIFYPYPGTYLNEQLKKKWHFSSCGVNVERCKATIDQPTFPAKDVERLYVWFDYYAFKGFIPWHRLLLRVIRAKIRAYPIVIRMVKLLIQDPLMHKIVRVIEPGS